MRVDDDAANSPLQFLDLHVHNHTAKGDLSTKRMGSPLYKASYNTDDMTSGAFDGTFTAPDSSTAPFGTDVGVYSIFSFEVQDKKTGGSKNWKNLLVAHSSAFPSTVTDDYVGPTNSILAETYQLTSLDPTTGVS